jgi:hypothetical protein
MWLNPKSCLALLFLDRGMVRFEEDRKLLKPPREPFDELSA